MYVIVRGLEAVVWEADAETLRIRFVSDPVVLPGMVVPIALDDAARAAVDAARASESGSGAKC